SNGLPAYSYQWKHGAANVGANAASYTITGAQIADAGAYSVVITDSLGQTVTSQTVVVDVGTLGTGTGLLGAYYSSQLKTFVEGPTLLRVDPTVNYDWGLGSPDPSISA